jgi:hypothetical protein
MAGLRAWHRPQRRPIAKQLAWIEPAHFDFLLRLA